MKAIYGEEIRLYPGEAPGSEGLSWKEELFEEQADFGRMKKVAQHTLYPTITAYIPENPNGVGVIVVPGGGFKRQVMNLEGSDIAEWLNNHGISAFVLKCRLPLDPHRHREDVALMDAQRAMRIIRSKAEEWKLNPSKLGIMGFSAGGHISSMLSTCYEHQVYERIDDIDIVSARPDFAVLAYPAISAELEKEKVLASETMVPEHIKVIMSKYSTDSLVNENTPPAFIFETDDDNITKAEHSIHYYLACRRAGVPAELHIFKKGGHGFGLGDHLPCVGAWKDLMLSWLETIL